MYYKLGICLMYHIEIYIYLYIYLCQKLLVQLYLLMKFIALLLRSFYHNILDLLLLFMIKILFIYTFCFDVNGGTGLVIKLFVWSTFPVHCYTQWLWISRLWDWFIIVNIIHHLTTEFDWLVIILKAILIFHAFWFCL